MIFKKGGHEIYSMPPVIGIQPNPSCPVSQAKHLDLQCAVFSALGYNNSASMLTSAWPNGTPLTIAA